MISLTELEDKLIEDFDKNGGEMLELVRLECVELNIKLKRPLKEGVYNKKKELLVAYESVLKVIEVLILRTSRKKESYKNNE